MELLGKLGIDWKLLIAQLVNFGLLLWLLTKFLYKPIIKRIEKDEAELKYSRQQKKQLERERKNFLEAEKKERKKIKDQARKIIQEAQAIAHTIKRRARDKAQKESQELIEQSKNNLKSLKPSLEREIFKSVHSRIGESFQKFFEAEFAPSLQKELQNVFWINFLKRLKALELEKLKGTKLMDVLEKFNFKLEGNGGGLQKALESEIEQAVHQEIGPLVLEYAYPLSAEQEQELDEVVSKKIGLKLKIIKKQNKELISGFCFEIEGVMIESNLLKIVDNATDFKQ